MCLAVVPVNAQQQQAGFIATLSAALAVSRLSPCLRRWLPAWLQSLTYSTHPFPATGAQSLSGSAGSPTHSHRRLRRARVQQLPGACVAPAGAQHLVHRQHGGSRAACTAARQRPGPGYQHPRPAPSGFACARQLRQPQHARCGCQAARGPLAGKSLSWPPAEVCVRMQHLISACAAGSC